MFHAVSIRKLYVLLQSLCSMGWMDGWMGGRMDGWMGGWMDGWMGGWVDGWMDGCMGINKVLSR